MPERFPPAERRSDWGDALSLAHIFCGEQAKNFNRYPDQNGILKRYPI